MRGLFQTTILPAILICALVLPSITLATDAGAAASGASSGLSSGVGGNYGIGTALFTCSNAGDKIVDALTELGKKPGDSKFITPTTQKPTSALTTVNAVPTTDSAATQALQQISQSAQKTQQAEQDREQREKCLNAVAYSVAKTTLAVFSQKTVAWADTGFGGDPLFIRDRKSFFNDLSNRELQQVIAEVQASGNPYATNIAQGLTQLNQADQSGTFGSHLNFTLDKVVGPGWTTFLNGDFKSGGWKGFEEIVQNPANTPSGAAQIAQQEAQNRASQIVSSTTQELQQNNGFLDLKKCVAYKTITPAPAPVTLDSSGSYSWNTGGTNFDVSQPDQISTDSSAAGPSSGTTPPPTTVCDRYETQTPGSVIESQLNLVLGSPVRQLELANSINETLGTVFDSIFNGLLNKGLADLSKSVSDTNNQVQTGDSYGANGSSAGNSASDMLGADNVSGENLFLNNPGSSWFGSNDTFDIKTDLGGVITTQQNYITAVQGSMETLKGVVPAVADLDYCIPGPNPVWEEETQQKVQEYITALQSNTWEDAKSGNITVPKWATTVGTGGQVVGTGLIVAGAILQVIPGIGTVVGAVVAGVGVLVKLVSGLFSSDAASDVQAANDYINGPYDQWAATNYYNGVANEVTQTTNLWNGYLTKIRATYDITKNILVAAEANLVVKNLRNYDLNTTAFETEYQNRIDASEVNIFRLNQIKAQVDAIVAKGKARAALANRACGATAVSTPGAVTSSGSTGVFQGGGSGSVGQNSGAPYQGSLKVQ